MVRNYQFRFTTNLTWLFFFWITHRIEKFPSRCRIHVGHPAGDLLEVHMGIFHSSRLNGNFYLLFRQLSFLRIRGIRLPCSAHSFGLGFGSHCIASASSVGTLRHFQAGKRIIFRCNFFIFLPLPCSKRSFCTQRFKSSWQATDEWGPKDPKIRSQWILFKQDPPPDPPMLPKWMRKMLKMDSIALKNNSIGHHGGGSLSTASIVRLAVDDESSTSIPSKIGERF